MRKSLLAAALLMVAGATFAAGDADPYTAPECPALAGRVEIDYTLLQDGSVWRHLYTIDSFDAGTGNFTGTGRYIPDDSYTEIITGTVVGNLVTFHILYTGTNANYMVDAMGTLDDSGALHGVAISVGQNFTWAGTPLK